MKMPMKPGMKGKMPMKKDMMDMPMKDMDKMPKRPPKKKK